MFSVLGAEARRLILPGPVVAAAHCKTHQKLEIFGNFVASRSAGPFVGRHFLLERHFAGEMISVRKARRCPFKRTYETRRVRFRWRVRERVWCWSRSDRVGPLVQTSPRPLTRTPDRVRSGTKTPSRMPNRVRSGTKTPSKHPHKYCGGLDFRGLFIFWLFFSFARQSFFFLWSCRLQYLFPPCKKRNGYSHSTLSVRVFRWKRTYGGSTSPLRRISRSISAVSSWSTVKVKRNISSWTFNSSW